MAELPQIKELTISGYLAELASDSLFPSAGCSAGITVAQAAALFAMVCRVNLRKLQEKGVNGSQAQGQNLWNFWQELLRQAEEYYKQSLALAQADGDAYLTYVTGDPHGGANSIKVPIKIARCASATARLIEDAFHKSYTPVRADAQTAHCLLRGSYQAALAVARYNLPLLVSEEQRQYYVNQIEELQSATPSDQLLT